MLFCFSSRPVLLLFAREKRVWGLAYVGIGGGSFEDQNDSRRGDECLGMGEEWLM